MSERYIVTGYGARAHVLDGGPLTTLCGRNLRDGIGVKDDADLRARFPLTDVCACCARRDRSINPSTQKED